MRIALFLLLFSISCVQTSPYTSKPSWTYARETTIRTKLGPVRVFNADSGYEVDTALLGEIFDRHVKVAKLIKKLELRIFPEKYVLPANNIGGFDITDDKLSGVEIGQTVSSSQTMIVVCVQPVGWAETPVDYSGSCAGVEPVRGNAEVLVTTCAIHELIGHGANRAANIATTDGEECEAQKLERVILKELSGRLVFRKKR